MSPKEFVNQRLRNSALLMGVIPVGTSFGAWLGKTIALPQLKKLAGGKIPWAPLRKPVSECKVALVSSAGVHLRSDHPFHLNGDPTYRVIPKDAVAADIAISHQAFDKTDALKDLNLIFPLERLRDLAAEHVIGSLAKENYGFGLMGSAARLIPAIKEVARRIADANVDLVLLVPA